MSKRTNKGVHSLSNHKCTGTRSINYYIKALNHSHIITPPITMKSEEVVLCLTRKATNNMLNLLASSSWITNHWNKLCLSSIKYFYANYLQQKIRRDCQKKPHPNPKPLSGLDHLPRLYSTASNISLCCTCIVVILIFWAYFYSNNMGP